jgi:transposase
MKRFIQGEHRGQSTLLPESLDDYVSDTNPVRVVDVFVNELDLVKLGFEGVIPADTGRPAYHPAILLKIYIYGYLNRIQSSRRLERAAQCNNRDRNFTSAKLKRRMEEIESSINRYLTALGEADQQEPSIAQPKAARLQEKIDKLKAQMKELQVVKIQLNESPDKQVSLTDPDARSMMTRGTGIVGYNVQTAVDTQHHLIVAHEVTNVGSDRDQLSSMAKQAREAMASDTLSVVADRGYFKKRRNSGLSRCQHHRLCAQADDLWSQSRRALQ